MFKALKNWSEKRQERIHEHRHARVLDLKETLSQIPTGKDLIDFAQEKNLLIRFKSGLNAQAKYLPRTRIQLSYIYPIDRQAPILAHETRHAWQEFNNLALRQKSNVLENVVMKRFGEADAFAIEAQIAWELTEHNLVPKAWALYKKHNKKLAKAYENAVTIDPKSVHNGKARSQVFEAWFDSEHLKFYDRSSIYESKVYLSRTRNGQRVAREFDKKRPDDAPPRRSPAFLRAFGQTSNGGNYLDHFNFKSRHIQVTSTRTKRAIAKLEQRYP